MKNKDYGGEPFVEGKVVPYDRKYHEVWETRQARMEKAAIELEAELATGVHKFEEVKISWWLMPQIWCKRAYLRWLRYKNKKLSFRNFLVEKILRWYQNQCLRMNKQHDRHVSFDMSVTGSMKKNQCLRMNKQHDRHVSFDMSVTGSMKKNRLYLYN